MQEHRGIQVSARSCLVNFPTFREVEAGGCEGLVTECKVRDVLKSVGLNKSPGREGLHYEVYLRLPHMFMPVSNHWFAQGAILYKERDRIAEDRYKVYLDGYKNWRYPWCNGYRRRNWTRRHEFISWTDCISRSTNTLGKGMNPIILPPAIGK